MGSPRLSLIAPAPVLLTSSGFYGTLAAVRSLGRAGIPIVVADEARLGPASWSRFVTRRERCPGQSSSAFIDWLLAFGEEHPGHVLYPTSDETAWVFAKNREPLSRCFHLYQPPLDAICSLLNKRQLDGVGRAEGLSFPRTWFPESDSDVLRVAREARFPVLVKPVTQMLHPTHSKGTVVDSPAHLADTFAVVATDPYAPELIAHDPTVVRPMIQEFHINAVNGIYNISGFIDEFGRVLGLRASKKVFQRPRRLGVGVCFEPAEIDEVLADAVVRVCRRVGYYGVFEVEFIPSNGENLLIDFNPRFYGQMGFDIRRGLPLPVLAYYAALGDRSAVTRLAAESAAGGDDQRTAYCHRIDLEQLLCFQRLSGALSAEEARHWRGWYDSRRESVVDAVIDSDDRLPAFSEILQQTYAHLRHPRMAARTMLLRSMLLGVNAWQLARDANLDAI